MLSVLANLPATPVMILISDRAPPIPARPLVMVFQLIFPKVLNPSAISVKLLTAIFKETLLNTDALPKYLSVNLVIIDNSAKAPPIAVNPLAILSHDIFPNS